MVNVLVISNQKGGIGKSFTASALAYLFSTDSHEKLEGTEYERKAQRVLLVDSDFQGDSTYIMTRNEPEDYVGKGLLEAINAGDATNYIVAVNDNLDVLPAAANLAEFDSLFTLNESKITEAHLLFSRSLSKVADRYDWIIIDTSPSLSKLKLQMLNCNVGGKTYVLVPMQTERLGYRSVLNFSDTLVAVQKNTNPMLRILGILPVLTDANMSVDKNIIEEARESFGKLLFSTVVKRRSDLKKMVESGFSEHYAVQRAALEDYYNLYNEVVQNVEK